MNHIKLRRAFIIFHLTLGIIVLIESVRTVMHSIGGEKVRHFDILLAVFASIEALAALLFLLPATMRLAGAALLLIFGAAIIFHGLHGQFLSTLFVYAAGVLFIMAHGSAFGKEMPSGQTPAS